MSADSDSDRSSNEGSQIDEGQMDKINKIWRVVQKIAKHTGVYISSDEDSGNMEDSGKKPNKQRARRSKNFLQSVRSSCPLNDRSAFEYVVANFHVCADVIRRCVACSKSFPETRVTYARVSLQ